MARPGRPLNGLRVRTVPVTNGRIADPRASEILTRVRQARNLSLTHLDTYTNRSSDNVMVPATTANVVPAGTTDLVESTADAYVDAADSAKPPSRPPDKSVARSIERSAGRFGFGVGPMMIMIAPLVALAARFAPAEESQLPIDPELGPEPSRIRLFKRRAWEKRRAELEARRTEPGIPAGHIESGIPSRRTEEAKNRLRMVNALKTGDETAAKRVLRQTAPKLHQQQLFNHLKMVFGDTLYNQVEFGDFLVAQARRMSTPRILEELNAAQKVNLDIGIAILQGRNISPEDLIGSSLFLRNPDLAHLYLSLHPISRNIYINIETSTAWVKTVAQRVWDYADRTESLRYHLLTQPEIAINMIKDLYGKYAAEAEAFVETMKTASKNGGPGRVKVIDLRDTKPKKVPNELNVLFTPHTTRVNYIVVTNGKPVSTENIGAYLSDRFPQPGWGEGVNAIFMVFNYPGLQRAFHSLAEKQIVYWGDTGVIARTLAESFEEDFTRIEEK